MKIGIAGFGYVGQAIHSALKDDVTAALYDIAFKDLDNIRTLQDSEIVFIALPSPSGDDGRQNVEAIASFFKSFDKAFGEQDWDPVFVLKSTMLWENARPFLENRRFVVNPEFLNQNSAFEDCAGQKTVVLGGRHDLTKKVEAFYKKHTLVEAAYEHMSAQEAVNFKYIRNIYGAYKVLFWNWVQEQTGNARKYATLYEKMPQGEMSQIAPDGKAGFGGACFPKDVAAFDFQNPHVLTKFIQEYNHHLRGGSETALNAGSDEREEGVLPLKRKALGKSN